MKKRDLILGPGIYPIAMTYCWVLPFFFFALREYRIAEHFKSYVPFFVAFIVTLIVALVLNFLSTQFSWWSRLGQFGRFGLLAGSYTVNIAVILFVTITLDAYNMVDYFGGDAGGSFGMFYVPSVVVNLIIALVVGVLSRISDRKLKVSNR